MAPARRSSVHSGPGLLETLPVIVKLLIAQAVHQEGNSSFPQIAALLKGHPLLAKLEPAYVVKADVSRGRCGWEGSSGRAGQADSRLGRATQVAKKAYEAMLEGCGLNG